MNFKVVAGLVGLVVVSTAGFFVSNTVTSTMVSIPQSELPQIENKTIEAANPKGKINRLNIPSSQVLFLTGEVDASTSNLVKEMKEKAHSGKELYLLIDSPGGSVLDGALVLSAMEALPVKINTVCIGTCASMAFIIHQYGAKRLAVNRSILMAHPASGGLQGTLEQMQSRLSTIKRYVDKMDLKIAQRMGLTLAQFQELSVSEFWVDAEDALEKKLVDEIVDVNTDAQPNPLNFLNNKKIKEKINLTY